jgi:hypothetical protein
LRFFGETWDCHTLTEIGVAVKLNSCGYSDKVEGYAVGEWLEQWASAEHCSAWTGEVARPHTSNAGRLDFLEEVGGLFAGFFGVVDGDLGGFLGSLCYVFASILGGVAGELEGFFGTISGFYGHGLGAAIDMGDGSVNGLDAVFADFIELDCGFFCTLFGLVRYHFCSFFESVKSVCGACIDTVNGGFADKFEGVVGAVGGLDDNGLGTGIQFGDGSVDSADHVLRGPAKRSQKQKGERCAENAFHISKLLDVLLDFP